METASPHPLSPPVLGHGFPLGGGALTEVDNRLILLVFS